MTILRLVGGSDVKPIFRCPDPPRHHDDEPPSTETAKNGKLREQRYKTWRMAEAATRYWRIRLDFDRAVSDAQRMEIPEGRNHPVDDSKDRQLLKCWREARVRQLLTPASHAAHVAWKQAALAGGQHQYTDVKPERIERAIADDLAFLAAHPVRQSNRKAAGDE
jgi:hypothetical protein